MLEPLRTQHAGSGWRRAVGQSTLAMNEAIVLPHWLCEERETKLTAIRSQVGVIRGDKWLIQQACCYQSRCTKDYWVYQVNNIGGKFFEPTDEKRTKEVPLQLWIKRKRHSRGTDDFCAGILIHAALRSQEQYLVSTFV